MSNSISKVRYALAGLLLFFCAAVQAQNISGNVKDSNGEPIIGATIMEQGTQNGTVTDFDGNFTLKLQKGGNLNISYVGMKPQVVQTAGKASVSVTLEDDNTTLNDVVVVGYGTMKRKDLTGSVSSVTGDALTKNPVANVSEALQGKLGGVNVMAQDGRPGGEMSIRVRGGGSITQSNDPLFIVDGIAVSSIDDIPADQIESIDVLKDASSTAIYGARGANGVILVTTKQAKEGKPQIRYNMYYQIKAKPKVLEMQDAYNYVRQKWEYATAYQGSGEQISKYYGLGQYGDINRYKNISGHNYMEDAFETGHMWNHDLSVSGGNEKTKYFASVGYTNDGATMKKTGFSRWNINLKLQQQLAKTLKLDIDARYSETSTQYNKFVQNTQNNNFVYPWMFNMIDDPADKDPNHFGAGGSKYAEDSYNPLLVIDDNNYVKKQQRVRLNTALTWNIIKNLTAKTELSVSRNWSKTQQWTGGNTGSDSKSQATLSQGDGYSTDWTTTLNYDFADLIKNENHAVNLLLGNEVLGSRSNSSSIRGTQYATGWSEDQAFGMIQMAKNGMESYGKNEIGVSSHTISWFTRANYNLLGRYLFTFTMRADGSSKFAEGNRWGYFPAGAIAWRISDEPFMKSSQSWLDNLKLRLSIGTSGNDGIDASAFIDKWTTEQNKTTGQFEFVRDKIKGNPDLTWEKTISRNVGIDYSFLNGKFNGSVDFYWNTTKDCLMLVPVSPTTGFDKQFQNVAKTSNKGIELAFNYNIIDKKDFNLKFGLTYNYNVNKVEKVVSANLGATPGFGSTGIFPGSTQGGVYTIVEGEPVGLIQGVESDGFYRVEDFLDPTANNGQWILKDGVIDTDPASTLAKYQGSNNYPHSSTQGAFPGMPKYKDVNNDGKIDDKDITVIGRMPAKHTGGFNFSGRYKNFDFSANFAYQLDGKVFNANAARSISSCLNDNNLGQSSIDTKLNNSWRMYNINGEGNLYLVTDPAELSALNAGVEYGLLGYTSGSTVIVSSDYIESAAFLRMQSLTFGYTFPKPLINKIGLSNARVYFTAGNLFCIKSYDGLDPDVNTNNSLDSTYKGFPTPGFDYNSYPRSRTFTFGLNVAF